MNFNESISKSSTSDEERRRNDMYLRFLQIKENVLKFREFIEKKLYSEESTLTDYGLDKLISHLHNEPQTISTTEISEKKNHIKLLQNQLDKRIESMKALEQNIKEYFIEFEKQFELLTTAFSSHDHYIFPLSNEILTFNLTKKIENFQSLGQTLADNQEEFQKVNDLKDEELDMYFYKVLSEYRRLRCKLLSQ